MGVLSGGRRYRILGTIGRGGFGTVYKAEHIGDGGFTKVVALKVLNPEAALVDEVASRMRDEARVLGLVRHRAIVQVDGLVQLEGRWAIVMEFIDGVDLRTVVSAGPVPRGPALEIVGEVAAALHQAYTQLGPDGAPLCLIHRDIKPSNVQLTRAGEVKVLDFGTARANFAAREAKTQELAFGTIDYMSPERMQFEDTPPGDIYALGALLYEMLTGHAVGRASPNPNRHEKVLARVMEGLEQASVDEELRSVVLRCLAYDPRERPDADELGRICRRLRSIGQDVWLVDWAREAIPPLEANRGPPVHDELTGTVLSEQSGSQRRTEPGQTAAIPTGPPSPPPAPPPAPPPERLPIEASETRWVQLPVDKSAGGLDEDADEDSDEVSPGAPPVPPVATAPPGATTPPVASTQPEAPPPPPGVRSVEPAVERTRAPPVPALSPPESGGLSAPVGAGAAIAVGGMVALGIGAVVVVGLIVVIWALWPSGSGDDGVLEPIDNPQPVEPVQPEPVEPEPVQPEPVQPEPEPVQPEPVKPVPPKPPPRPPPAPRGTVVVKGDALSVVLVDSRGHERSPGKVTPGKYTVRATFEGRGAVTAGEVEVVAGQTVTLKCARAFGRCSVQ